MGSSEGHPRGTAIVTAARALVGTMFRPQGRGPDGLDCVGLAARAAADAGVSAQVRHDLPLRGLRVSEADDLLRGAGCSPVAMGQLCAGDLLMRSVAVRQIHVALWTGAGVIEAHAGLRRVVERPLAASETWCAAWRLPM